MSPTPPTCPQCGSTLDVLFYSVSCYQCDTIAAWRRFECDPRWRGAVDHAAHFGRMRRIEGRTRAELFERVEAELYGVECWATRMEPHVFDDDLETLRVRIWVGTAEEYARDYGDLVAQDD